MTLEANKALVRRFYDELWNGWDFGVIGEILTPDIVFRGSLGAQTTGHDGFIGYAESVRAAFPDFHNTVEQMIAEGDRLAACLTYRGTHSGGEIFNVPPTGRKITYTGVAIFLFRDALISHAFVLGDRFQLMLQLGAIEPID
jgi:predicted ester cyclase